MFFHFRKVSTFFGILFVWQMLSLADFKPRQDSMLLFTTEVSLQSYSFSQPKMHSFLLFFIQTLPFITLFPISVISVRCDTAFYATNL